MEDNPKKPYKMYAALASAFFTTLLADEALNWNPWARAIVVAVVAAVAVFFVRNPVV